MDRDRRLSRPKVPSPRRRRPKFGDDAGAARTGELTLHRRSVNSPTTASTAGWSSRTACSEGVINVVADHLAALALPASSIHASRDFR